MAINYSVILWALVLGNALYQAESVLKTTFIEDLCYDSKLSELDLKYETSGILMSAPRVGEGVECQIVLSPPRGAHVVLSIYRYDLDKEDVLIIEDSDRHRVALMGYGVFRNEKKSVISEGKMRIHYSITGNGTHVHNQRAGFQFTYTKVMKSPCSSNEFKCDNGYCVLKNYMCDGHNHCGDSSDQKKCGSLLDPVTTPELPSAPNNTRSTIFVSLIIVGGIVLLIVIIVFIVYVVKGAKLKKAIAKNPNPAVPAVPLQTVSSAVPLATTVPAVPLATTVPAVPRQPATVPVQDSSFYNRVRRSFRGARSSPNVDSTEHQQSVQVPSMYPSLEAAHEMYGVENKNFRNEE